MLKFKLWTFSDGTLLWLFKSVLKFKLWTWTWCMRQLQVDWSWSTRPSYCGKIEHQWWSSKIMWILSILATFLTILSILVTIISILGTILIILSILAIHSTVLTFLVPSHRSLWSTLSFPTLSSQLHKSAFAGGEKENWRYSFTIWEQKFHNLRAEIPQSESRNRISKADVERFLRARPHTNTIKTIFLSVFHFQPLPLMSGTNSKTFHLGPQQHIPRFLVWVFWCPNPPCEVHFLLILEKFSPKTFTVPPFPPTLPSHPPPSPATITSCSHYFFHPSLQPMYRPSRHSDSQSAAGHTTGRQRRRRRRRRRR